MSDGRNEISWSQGICTGLNLRRICPARFFKDTQGNNQSSQYEDMYVSKTITIQRYFSHSSF